MMNTGRRTAGLGLLLMLLAWGCAADDPLDMAERFDLPRTGPTTLARASGGYELQNRVLRVLIDETSGDVRYWGSADGERNLLGETGAWARLEATETPPVGYVEKRDDQTWQYLGDDAFNRIAWRKVYCLEGSSLLATFIAENTGTEPLRSTIVLNVSMAGEGRPRIALPDLFEMDSDLGRVLLRGFRERADPGESASIDGLRGRLVSDEFLLRPGERFSFTTEWRINPDLRVSP